jgi:hypothetical protein
MIGPGLPLRLKPRLAGRMAPIFDEITAPRPLI